MARRAGDAAAGMGSGAAHVEARQRPAVVAVAEHRPRREQLIQLSAPWKMSPPTRPKVRSRSSGLMICRPSTEALKFGRMRVDGVDHQVGHRLAMRRPTTAPSGSCGRDMLAEQAGHMLARRRQLSSSVEGISISTIGCARPAVGARVDVGAIHVGERWAR